MCNHSMETVLLLRVSKQCNALTVELELWLVFPTRVKKNEGFCTRVITSVCDMLP